jgi:putative ABC transport system permease protein
VRSWRPLLRLARRDAVRARGRSLLVLVMIALPVLAVTVADIVIATQDVSGTEAVERRLGAADARVSVEKSFGKVWQGADPDRSLAMSGGGRQEPIELGDVERTLGGDVRALELVEAEKRVETDGGVSVAGVRLVDLADPLAKGLFRLDDGRLPQVAGETVVNHALADRGPGLGETLTMADGTELEVVGVGDHTAYRSFPHLVAPPGSLELRTTPGTTWLVDAGGPVGWDAVRALNEQGATVLSRAVLADPPSEDELPMEARGMTSGADSSMIAVVVLVVTMALLEVVLLAGPAFAVTARRQSRTLALMAATGGTPKQARRAVLATGVVLGVVGAVVGVVGGIVVAWVAAVPVAQSFSGSFFGPFDVPWLHLLVIAAFGFVSAVLAAAVPAWIASRQDVVAVLAGRRGDSRPSARSPLLGLVLLGGGVAMAAYGATRGVGGELFIAASALLAVLGMILLVPVVVVGLARVCGGLPLVVRYAVRDAARHRTRTVPAVAAVAATVTGVVALGIATSSDAKENEVTYAPTVAMGEGLVTAQRLSSGKWEEIEQAVRDGVPGGEITPVRGVPTDHRTLIELDYRAPAGPRNLLESWGGSLGTTNLVATELPGAVTGLSAEERVRADQTLAAGGLVVFTSRAVEADSVAISGKRWPPRGRPEKLVATTELPATYVRVGDLGAGPQAVLPPSVAEELGLDVETVAVHVAGTEISDAEQRAVSEAVEAIEPYTSLYVERGYEAPDEDRIVLLVLGGLGAVLMLGGTLTATFLALSDARPDLATLSAVGAAPRTRRAVAAAYALVVGLVGATLGAVIGFVPGIAVTYPLTGNSWATTGVDGSALPTHYLAIPWGLIAAIVVALPVLTALVVGLSARSRLPLVARLD